MDVRHVAMTVAALGLAACAGSGSGLDENGRPTSGGEVGSLTPDFSSIQQQVLTPVCTVCHSGAAAPLGLRLDAEVAYANLVNAPSVQVEGIARVAPGNPDASYLIQKLEGTADVGGRMPLFAPALTPETIAVIRQWITDGAPASGNAAAAVASIQAVSPAADATLTESPREVVLSSNVQLDTTLLSAGVLSLHRSGGDGEFSNGNEQPLKAAVTVRSLEPTVFALTAPSGEWVADEYELRISGGLPLALTDLDARPIDGDGDGVPGGDFVLRFIVESAK